MYIYVCVRESGNPLTLKCGKTNISKMKKMFHGSYNSRDSFFIVKDNLKK